MKQMLNLLRKRQFFWSIFIILYTGLSLSILLTEDDSSITNILKSIWVIYCISYIIWIVSAVLISNLPKRKIIIAITGGILWLIIISGIIEHSMKPLLLLAITTVFVGITLARIFGRHFTFLNTFSQNQRRKREG